MLEELEQQERDDRRRAEEQRARDELDALHSAAYVDGLMGSVLFKTLFVEDTDAERFHNLPDMPDMLRE
jgi:hypothetical protein